MSIFQNYVVIRCLEPDDWMQPKMFTTVGFAPCLWLAILKCKWDAYWFKPVKGYSGWTGLLTADEYQELIKMVRRESEI